MAQVKIYGLKDTLNPIKAALSDAIHACVVEVLQFPPDKRAHRFFPLERDDFYMPAGRTDAYLILEFSMMAGRSVETKKRLIHRLFEHLHSELNLSFQDIEIFIEEAPKSSWGFRGKTGDEIELNYKVDL